MKYTKIIEEKLNQAFQPEFLFVHDDSAKHKGHANAPEGGESHFHVEMKAAAFNDLSRLQRQRLVYKVLEDELRDQIHALSLKLDGV